MKRHNRKPSKTAVVAILTPAFIISSAFPGMTVSAAAQGTAAKAETVYVNTDSTGRVENVIVSDWLHDDISGAVIEDKSELSGITNVKGNEVPTINGNSVTWQLCGTDLYYQGSTTKQVPVTMTVQYYLDGAAVSPSDLAGKSGKVEIKISFKNNDAHSVVINGTERTLYTPFLCAVAFDLPSKYFSNVTTNFGEVESDGINQAVSFVGLPGFKESFYMLDSSSINIPDTLDITADATNFQLGPIMMLATPVPDMDKLADTGSLSELFSKLDEIYNAGLQLKDGADTLNASEETFAEGMQELYSNVSTAGAAFDQIVSGAGSLTSAASQLADGTEKLFSQFQNSADGSTLKDAIDSLYGQMKTTADYKTDPKTVNDIIKALADTSSGASNYVDTVNSIFTLLRADTSVYSTIAGEVNNDITAYQSSPTAANLSKLSNALTLLVMVTDTDNSTENTTTNTTLSYLSSAGVTGLPSSAAAAQQALSGGGDKIVGGIDALDTQFSYSSSTMTFYDGIAALEAQTKSSTTGTPTLYDSIAALNSGAHSLSRFMSTLDTSLIRFKSGLSQLLNGTATLTDGSKQLASGASALAAGMNTFWDEGLSKLNGSDRTKLDEAVDVKNELVKLAEDYTTFSGTGDGISSSVKFIEKTDEIKAETPPSTSTTTATTENLNIFQKIIAWFKSLF